MLQTKGFFPKTGSKLEGCAENLGTVELLETTIFLYS
jgi:hypothetical protein